MAESGGFAQRFGGGDFCGHNIDVAWRFGVEAASSQTEQGARGDYRLMRFVNMQANELLIRQTTELAALRANPLAHKIEAALRQSYPMTRAHNPPEAEPLVHQIETVIAFPQRQKSGACAFVKEISH